MKNKFEQHFVMILCALLTSLVTLSGVVIALMGAYQENMDTLRVGAHVTVWPVVLFLVGVGMWKGIEG